MEIPDSGFSKALEQIKLDRALKYLEKKTEVNLLQKKEKSLMDWTATTEDGKQMPFGEWFKNWTDKTIDNRHAV